MSQEKVYPVTEATSKHSYLNRESYEELYKKSVESPEEFWAEQAGELIHWHEPWTSVKQGDFRIQAMNGLREQN